MKSEEIKYRLEGVEWPYSLEDEEICPHFNTENDKVNDDSMDIVILLKSTADKHIELQKYYPEN